MQPRSWLFVPADSEKKVAKALESDADAIIFDLEDSVASPNKAAARDILKQLPKRVGGPQWWVRVNPLGSKFHKDDLHLIGRESDARATFERVLALRNDVGLLSEEYDPVAKRQVGNTPQAFSHVPLVNTARALSRHGDTVGRVSRSEPRPHSATRGR